MARRPATAVSLVGTIALSFLLLAMTINLRADATATYRTSLSSVSSSWACGDNLAIVYSGTWDASYLDKLPPGAKVTNVKVIVLMGQTSGVSMTPTVTAALNGQIIGSADIWNGESCPMRADLPEYTFDQPFPSSMPNYNVGSSNTVSLTVKASCYAPYSGRCGVTVADDAYTGREGAKVIVTYTTGIETYVYSGDGQSGSVSGPVELVARLQKFDTDTILEGKSVEFKITAQPLRTNGSAVGADERATAMTYSTMADSAGLARATLLLGDSEGTYQVEAISPLTNTKTPATFTVNALKPAAIRIARLDDPQGEDETYRATHSVLPVHHSRFRAVGFDTSGNRIGAVRADWKTAVAKNATNPGAATLGSPNSSSWTGLTPTAFGRLTLEATANPRMSGVSAGKTDIEIGTGLFVWLEGTFDPANPIDQLPQFVPGSMLNGESVPLDGAAALPQPITLHVITPTSTTGSVRFELTEVSNYPGLAMNWPVKSPISADDMYFRDASDQSVRTLPAVAFESSGDTTAVLYVNDYGARATLKVVVSPSGKASFTIGPISLPLDTDGNGLPDHGWTAIDSVAIETASLIATGDDDPADGAVGTDAAVIGDGMSNFEEFRGFVVGNCLVRLNPQQKEIFVDADPEFLLATDLSSPASVLATLPSRVLYVEPTEVAGQDRLSRNLLRTQGVIAFNRATVPVAHDRAQRAVRLIYQSTFPPAVHLAGPNIDVPAWQVGILGGTFSDDVLDIDILNAPGNPRTLETPMRTQFSELYARTFTNLAVSTTFSYPYHFDEDGNVVPRCTFQGEANCDYWDEPNNLIIPSLQDGAWGVLYTVPTPEHDPVEHYSLQARTCGDDTPIIGGLDSIAMERLKGLIGAHELAHAIGIDHLRTFSSDCGDLMFDDEASSPSRRTMSIYMPQPQGFSLKDVAMMRLWQP